MAFVCIKKLTCTEHAFHKSLIHKLLIIKQYVKCHNMHTWSLTPFIDNWSMQYCLRNIKTYKLFGSLNNVKLLINGWLKFNFCNITTLWFMNKEI